jgi:predicted translin family RNA/ssDNA-binding protein
MAPEVQGINRYRYARSLDCLEELVEALTFYHYLKTQTLISHKDLSPIVDDLIRQGVAASEDAVMENAEAPKSAKESESLTIGLTDEDYLYGVFDLTGEMMRFATTSSALTGKLASGDTEDGRNIVQDMHELGSFFEMLPRWGGNKITWDKKLEVTRQSVQKVEKLGYDLKVRGSERPKGWIPDLNATEQEAEE